MPAKKRSKKRFSQSKFNDSMMAAVNAALAEHNQAIFRMQLRLLAMQTVLQEKGALAFAEVEAHFQELERRLTPTEEGLQEERLRLLRAFDGKPN